MSEIFGTFHRRPDDTQRSRLPDSREFLRGHQIFSWDSPTAAEWGRRFRERLDRGQTLYLLGFQGLFHNSGVSLVEASRAGGIRLLANYEEERFSGRKHHAGYPELSLAEIRRLLASMGKTTADLFCVCHAWDVSLLEKNAQPVPGEGPNDYDAFLAFSVISEEAAQEANRPGRTQFFLHSSMLATLIGRLRRDLGLGEDWPCFQMAHHENHAYFSYGSSPFCREGANSKPTLVACLDGNGDIGSSSFFLASGTSLELIKRQPIWDSIGNFYTLVSSFLGGWTPLSAEGRYMGAAAWGCGSRLSNPYYKSLRQAFYFDPNGDVRSNRAFAANHYADLQRILGPFLKVSDLWNPDAVLNLDEIRHADATRDRVNKAAAVQMVFEDALFHLLGHLLVETGCDQLVLCGGVALNCVANLRLLEHFDESFFRRSLGVSSRLNLWVPPIPSDQGAVAGAPYQFALLHGARPLGRLPTPFLCGMAPTSVAIREALNPIPTLQVQEFGDIREEGARSALADWMAYVVSRDGVLGIFQGEAETGPRALGHRSLLSNPRNERTLDILNSRVKRRERIRPLAPMVTLEEASRWFELSPGAAANDYCAYDYMVLTARARPCAQEAIPAVIHCDGTSRIQIVRKENNPLIHDFLRALGRRNGAEVSVNTSLNVGSPIVQTPAQALEVFRRAKGLDGLVMIGSDGRALVAWAKPGTQEFDSRLPELWKEYVVGAAAARVPALAVSGAGAARSLADPRRETLEALRSGTITKMEALRRIQALASEQIPAASNASRGRAENRGEVAAPAPSAPEVRTQFESAPSSRSSTVPEPIAVIGMAGRFPGAASIREFWNNLRLGVDSVSEIPRERWDIDSLFDPVVGTPGKISCRMAGMLEGVEEFDPQFFNISPREAAGIDPQSRLLLQEIWKAVEDSGYKASSFSGKKIGVFVGGGTSDYLGRNAHQPSTEASRISYLFDWKGPCQCIETSCSSGLVAVHEACLHLQARKLRVAVVGAATLFTTPYPHLGFSQMNMLSSQGKCFSFDKRADGTVFSEAVCAVVLKPLSEAVADRDHIYGVIRGSNTNYDGKTNGITSPSGASQMALEIETYEQCGVRPEQITLVEAHGTGTKLGDPVEVNALIKAFRHFTSRSSYCALGTVKSNIGHTASVAGLAGLIKALLSVKHREIPPSLHFQEANPEIAFEGSPFYVNTSLRAWNVPAGEARIAAVSSFGVGGTNAHVVLSEPPETAVRPKSPAQNRPRLVLLSAQSLDQLQTMAAALRDHVDREAPNGLRIEDVAWTLQVGREAMGIRWACVAKDLAQLREHLAGFVRGDKGGTQVWFGDVKAHKPTAALFSSNADLQSLVPMWIRRREWATLADLWVKGCDIPWNHESGDEGTRIPLPTYVFAKLRCWISKPLFELGATIEGDSSRPMGKLPIASTARFDIASKNPTLEPRALIHGVVLNPKEPLPPPPPPVPDRPRIALRSPGEALGARASGPGDLGRTLRPISLGRSAEASAASAGEEPRSFQSEGQPGPKSEPLKPSAPLGPSLDLLERELSLSLADALFLKVEDVDPEKKFIDMGLDSIVGVEWVRTLNAHFRLNLPATRVYDHPTIREFAAHLLMELSKAAQSGVQFSAETKEPAAGRVEAVEPPKSAISAANSTVAEAGAPPLDQPIPERPRAAELERELSISLAEALFLKVEEVDREKKFIDMGLDSIVGVEWIRTLNQRYGVSIAATKIYDHPTVQEFAEYLATLLTERTTTASPTPSPDVPKVPDLKGRTPEIPSGSNGAASVAVTLNLGPSPVIRLGPTVGKSSGANGHGNGHENGHGNGHANGNGNTQGLESVHQNGHAGNVSEGGVSPCGSANGAPIAESPRATAVIPRNYGVVLTTTHTLEEVRLSEWDPGVPAPDELGIRVRASALNFPDTMCVKGFYPTMPEYPFVPGFEVAGVVESIGDAVQGFSIGDHVVALTGSQLGGHASRVNVPAGSAVRKPVNLSFEEACSLPVVFGTVYYALEVGRLAPGERVLIQTATGGCGLMALQLAWLRGCVCYGTSSAEEKRALLRRFGVLGALDYKGPFDREILALTDGRGVDVVLNMVSGEAIQRGLNCLGAGGRYLELASHALRTSPRLDLSRLTENQTIHSIDLRKLGATGKLPTGEVLKSMTAMVERGEIVPIVSRIYPIHQIADAIRYVASGGHVGKVVISHTAHEMEDCRDRCIARILEQRERALRSVPPPRSAAAASESESAGMAASDVLLRGGIAIVGMAGRFPKARTLDQYWENLAAGRDCISEVPAERWSTEVHYDPRPKTPGKTDCKWMGVLEDIDAFDPHFFSIPPIEAEWMDPQQRLFLEGCWHCLEDAGIRPSNLSGSRCGVFVGCSEGDYGKTEGGLHAQGLMGGALSILAGRISYLLNLQGPCMAIDTACSSSLVAIAEACDSLVLRHCDAALAGGVCVHTGPGLHIMASQAGMLSRDGRCFTFDQRANGFVPGEGVGVLLLKRLEDAIRDRDEIHGVLRGWGVNQDGKTNGITAPSVKSQIRLETEVYRRFAINPESISFVEAHGTGTQLGDPIEIEALTQAFRGFTSRSEFCALGSVKSNIGHLLTAAGVSGVIKVLLALRHRAIPPAANFESLNGHLRLEGSPFFVNQELRPWNVPSGSPRRACVSSFGFSGTNAHLVLEEAMPAARHDGVNAPDREESSLLVLSAKSPSQLRDAAERLAGFLESSSAIRLADVAYTLQVGREAMKLRFTCLVDSRQAAVQILRTFSNGQVSDGVAGADQTTPGSPVAAPAVETCRDPGALWDLGKAWVRGAVVDWQRLPSARWSRRIPVPGYPFARERHWIAMGPAPSVPVASQPETAGSPVLTDFDPTDSREAGIAMVLVPEWVETSAAAASSATACNVGVRRVIVACALSPAVVAELTQQVEPTAEIISIPDKGPLSERLIDAATAIIESLKQARSGGFGCPVLVQIVHPTEGEHRGFAAMHGFSRSVTREFPQVRGQVIGVDPVACSNADALSRLLKFEGSVSLEERVRYSGGRREVRQWREVDLKSLGAGPEWRRPGAFWIPGGGGGLGILVAEFLANRSPGCRVFLTGRRAATPELLNRIETLRRRNLDVTYDPLDLCDAKGVEEFVLRLEQSGILLDGVFHAAGVRCDGSLRTKTREEFRSVLLPKVDGTLNLEHALRRQPAAWVVLFSSTAGVMGNAGQADYATANAFLDVLAEEESGRVSTPGERRRVMAIHWPLWEEGGMTVSRSILGFMKNELGLLPLPTATGLSVLECLLGAAVPQAMVVFRARSDAQSPDTIPKPTQSTNPAQVAHPRDLVDRVAALVKGLLCETIKADPGRVEDEDPLEALGLDSILIATFHAKLAIPFPQLGEAVLYERQSVRTLSAHLWSEHRADCVRWCGVGVSEPPEGRVRLVESGVAPLPGVRESRLLPDRVSSSSSSMQLAEPIAIIGLSGRFPQARTVEAFWDNLISGHCAITTLPFERWNWPGFVASELGTGIAGTAIRGGFVESFDQFDPLFFGITPADALNLDPQERLILTHCWEAMENSGHSRASLRERYDGRIGVFVGVTKSGFRLHTKLGATLEESVFPASSFSSMANRVSYHLNLVGPSMAIDTMCSSAMTALHEACEHIRRGECSMAFVGTANLYLHPRDYLDLALGRMLTDESSVRCFSKQGRGFLPGEGAGALLLKPLSQAVKDGDPVHAVIRGSAVRHGGRTHGYTVPSVDEQRDLVNAVLARAGVMVDEIDYVECAANGSRMGDAIELEALSQVFQGRRSRPCFIGSVKPNIGHLEAASGLSQLAKVIGQMRHQRLAPTLMEPGDAEAFRESNSSPFELVTESRPWLDRAEEPNRALISSFGAGGSYAAVVLESYKVAQSSNGEGGRAELIVLSARTESQLQEQARRLLEAVRPTDVNLAAVARTLQVGRDAMEYRAAMVVGSASELVCGLESLSSGRSSKTILRGGPGESARLREVLRPVQIRDLLDRALAVGDLQSIGDLWTQGANEVAWRVLHPGDKGRVTLPVYPLESRSLWYGAEVPSAVVRNPGLPAASVPTLQSSIEIPVLPEAGFPGDLLEATRNRIRALVRELMLLRPEDDVSSNRTFFDLGLDSISSVRLIQKLGLGLGVSLPETLFLDHPTIDRLSAYLAGQKFNLERVPSESVQRTVVAARPEGFKDRLQKLIVKWPELVPLQVEGEGPILFCVHPMSGDVGVHGKLADASQGSFRVIGLRSRGLRSQEAPWTDIESMARFNADLLTAVHEGPYFLLGPSMGGAVAYETVRELLSRGRSIGGLILLEAPILRTDSEAALWDTDELTNWRMNANFMLITYLHLDPEFRRRKAAGEIRWSELEITPAEVDGAGKEAVVEGLVTAIRRRGVTQDPEIIRRGLVAMARVHLANLRSLKGYRPVPLRTAPGFPVLLLHTRDGRATSEELFNPPYLSRVQEAHGGIQPLFEEWRRLIPSVRFREIEGRDHLDLLNTRAAAEQIAELVREVVFSAVPKAPPARADRPPVTPRIAVVGMSGRFPGAPSIAEFWQVLSEGRVPLSALPSDRGWDLESLTQGPAHLRSYVTHGGFLESVAKFDAEFFGITLREAELMDPSERLFLEESWKAIEDSRARPGDLAGKRWGVFCGGGGDYPLWVRDTFGVSPSATSSGIAGRVAYTLDLKGPVLSVDSGCASSLAAIAQACDQLVLGNCEAAIAGGVWIYSTPNLLITGCRNELFSRPGGARALDAESDGMMPAEAVGVLVLKRYEDAVSAGDRVYGVIEGWGSGHNGRTNGMAAPSVTEQAALMTRVWEGSGVASASIGLLELNASGSRLGDAVEMQAFLNALGPQGPDAGRRWVGSVENNVGHAFQASGVVHLIKVLLALHHRMIPPTPNVRVPHPALGSFAQDLTTKRAQFWNPSPGQPRRAVVNSFGATGTLLHLILSESPDSGATPRPKVAEGQKLHRFGGTNHWIHAPRGTKASEPTASLPASSENLRWNHDLVALQRLFLETTGIEVSDLEFDRAFTELGLESMGAMRFTAALNEQTGASIGPADLLECATLRALDQRLRSSIQPAPLPSPVGEAKDSVRAPWLAQRLARAGRTLEVASLPGMPARSPARRSRAACTEVLKRLLSRGVALFHDGVHCHLIADPQVRVREILKGLTRAESNLLSQRLPLGVLMAPVAQEQEGQLHQSENLRNPAWNVHQTFDLGAASLDLKRIRHAVAQCVELQDSLRTRFQRLGAGWIQCIHGAASIPCTRIRAKSLEAFQGFVLRQQARRFRVSDSPLLRLWVCEMGDRVVAGLVIHHACADAFSPSILIDAVTRALGSRGSDLEPVAAQYWEYALAQSNTSIYRTPATLEFWRKCLSGRSASARLPWRVTPEKVTRDSWRQGRAHVISMSGESSAEVLAACRRHGCSFSQLFTAGLCRATGKFFDGGVPVFRYLVSQRSEWRLRGAVGDFGGVMLVPFDLTGARSGAEAIASVRRTLTGAMNHARVRFSEMLALAGYPDLKAFFNDPGDLWFDSVDLDAASTATDVRPWRSLHDHLLENAGSAVGECAAIGTLFVQVLKVNGLLHVLVSSRTQLLESEFVETLGRRLVDSVLEMARDPQRAMESSAATESGLSAPAALSGNRRTHATGAGLPPLCQPLNRVDRGRPVFWFHAGLGGVEGYQPFAAGVGRPFYGIHAQGWLNEAPPIRGLHAMASHYWELIRTVQPKGPYDFGGYSLGGLLAYEVVRLAQRQSASVRSVVMLDTLDPRSLRRIRLSERSGMLQAVNAALLVSGSPAPNEPNCRLIHRSEVDPSLAPDAFLEQLIRLARDRRLSVADSVLKDLIQRRSRVQGAYEPEQFRLYPLTRANDVEWHYVRNAGGLFLGPLTPYFTLPGDRLPDENRRYWKDWMRVLPRMAFIDVSAESHASMLSEPSVIRRMRQLCSELYPEEKGTSASVRVSRSGPK